MRVSEQCRAIIEELCRMNVHPTANDIYRSLRNRMPRISLGTVYRNLELLSQKGIVKKIHAVGTQRRYDGNTVKHYHIHCNQCGRLDDLPAIELKCVTDLVGEISDYHILWHNIVFIGICPACKAGERFEDGSNFQFKEA